MSEDYLNNKFIFDYKNGDKCILIIDKKGFFEITLIDDENNRPVTLGTSDLFGFFKVAIDLVGQDIRENGITYYHENKK